MILKSNLLLKSVLYTMFFESKPLTHLGLVLVLRLTLQLDLPWVARGGVYRWLVYGKVERPMEDMGRQLAERAVCESEGRLMDGCRV